MCPVEPLPGSVFVRCKSTRNIYGVTGLIFNLKDILLLRVIPSYWTNTVPDLLILNLLGRSYVHSSNVDAVWIPGVDVPQDRMTIGINKAAYQLITF